MLDLRDDGTIGIDFDSEQVVLRRPTLGIVEQLDFKRTEIQHALQAVTAEINGRDPKPEPVDALREARAKSKELVIEWWETAAKLFEVELPDPDEWPPYLVWGKGVLATIIEHWNTVPLAFGGQPVPRETPTPE